MLLRRFLEKGELFESSLGTMYEDTKGLLQGYTGVADFVFYLDFTPNAKKGIQVEFSKLDKGVVPVGFVNTIEGFLAHPPLPKVCKDLIHELQSNYNFTYLTVKGKYSPDTGVVISGVVSV